MIDRDLDETLKNELHSGEELLWRSQPDPWRVAKTTLPIFLFAIPWTVFAVFWETMALGIFFTTAFGTGHGAPGGIGGMAFAVVFPLFGLPFIVIGIGMLGAPWWAYKAAQRTIYAISTDRAMIINLWWKRSFQSFEKIDPSKIRRVEDNAGSGDLFFHKEITISDGDEHTKEIGFHGVRQVRRVEEVLRNMISGETTDSSHSSLNDD